MGLSLPLRPGGVWYSPDSRVPCVHSRKPKWEEQELEELGEEEEDEEDEDDFEEEEEEEEEDLGPPESASLGSTGLFTSKAPLAQAFRGDGGPKMLSGPERLGPGPAHSGHVASQMPPPDHGDWTFEEQFKQVGHVLGSGPLGALITSTDRRHFDLGTVGPW